jgi:hypothetical protein
MAQILIQHQQLSHFRFIFVAMIFFSNKNSTPLKIFQIGAVGDLVWRFCGKKWGARRGLPGMCPQIRQPQAELLWNILMPSLKLPNLGAHTRGTFEQHAHFGGSCPPLVFLAGRPLGLARTIYIYGVFLAWKSPNIRCIYTYIYGSGQP